MRIAFATAVSCFVAILATPRDAASQTTARVSVSSGGAEGNGFSAWATVSGDGRFVAFQSGASNLVSGDANGVDDVFVRDRVAGTTTRVSVDSLGTEGNGLSGLPAISSDGRWVTFTSSATNLVSGDTNAVDDVFVHDRATGATARASVDSASVQGNGTSFGSAISSDGRYVAFTSEASNLVTGDTNAVQDVFVRDRAAGTTSRASVDSLGTQADGASTGAAISSDGSVVAFDSDATNLVAGDANGATDVFVRDRTAGATSRASVATGGAEANDLSNTPSLSGDGRYVAFWSIATNLAPGAALSDVYVRDRVAGTTTLASVDSAGAPSTGGAGNLGVAISGDGRWVAFQAYSTNLVSGDTNGVSDVFVRDTVLGFTVRASISTAGVQGNDNSQTPSLSADGQTVAFFSPASTLVAGDTNGGSDVFVRELRDVGLCATGTVGAAAGPIADVLRIDGSTGDVRRVVDVPLSSPIAISLDASPSGPGGPGDSVARYAVWIWRGFASNPSDVIAMGDTLGCTVNPSPLRPLAAPQAAYCLAGTGMPPAACGSVHALSAPARAPWTRMHPGFAHPVVLTLQGILQDAGATSTRGFSVTNAVTLRVM
jgi:Tol biopolymer transport system component